MAMEKNAYTVGDVAKLCGVSRSTVRNWITAGKVSAYTLPGGHQRVSRDVLAAFAEGIGMDLGVAETTTPSTASYGSPDEGLLAEQPLSILIVDDEATVSQSLKEGLVEIFGDCTVRTANEGTSGLLAAGMMRPQIVVLDVMMPGLNGAEVCRQIRKMPELSHTRVIVVSGFPEAPETIEARLSGADAFLPKPASARDVARQICRLLNMPEPQI